MTSREKNFKKGLRWSDNEFFYKTFLNVMKENYELPFKELLKILNEKLNTTFDRDSVLDNIRKIKFLHGDRIAKHLFNIFNHSIYLHNKDYKNVEIYKKKIDEFMKKEMQRKDYVHHHSKIESHEKCIDDVNRELDVVLKEKKSISDLYNERKIKRKDLFTLMKKNISEVDYNRYIDFCIINNKLEIMEEEEVNQYVSVIEFFLTNLRKNKELLDNINIATFDKKELEEINNIVDNINIDNTKTNETRIKNKYYNKLNKISLYINILENILNNINLVRENINTEELNESIVFSNHPVSDSDMKLVINYYKEIKKCLSVRKKALSINTINEREIDKIRSLYNEKVLKFAKK